MKKLLLSALVLITCSAANSFCTAANAAYTKEQVFAPQSYNFINKSPETIVIDYRSSTGSLQPNETTSTESGLTTLSYVAISLGAAAMTMIAICGIVLYRRGDCRARALPITSFGQPYVRLNEPVALTQIIVQTMQTAAAAPTA